MNSVSINVAPRDNRCRHWAKFIAAGTVLKPPSEVDRAADLPGRFLREGEEELSPGDFMIEGEENHHRKERGWTYRLSYVGLDGSLQQVVPTTEMKQAMKSAGMAAPLLRGSGQLAACVRLIEGLRLHIMCGVMPLNTPGGPVSKGQYAVTKQLSEIWFRQSEDATEPCWREVVATALEMNCTSSEPAELELPAEVFAD